MKKRILKNAVSVKFINNEGKTYTTSKKDLEHTIKRWKTQMLALGLAVGMAMPSVITNIANDFNKANDTKEAVQIAASTESYLENIKANPTMQTVISQEEAMQIAELSSAIVRYKELSHKEDKSFKEQEDYVKACKKISESRDLVIDMYSDAIKAKVAKAYGITKTEEINAIKVTDYSQDGAKIVLPDGKLITMERFMNPNISMDATLAKHVAQARSLKDAGEFSENQNISDLPIEDIILVFEEAKTFTENYMVFSTKDGDLEAVETKVNGEVASAPIEVDEPEL